MLDQYEVYRKYFLGENLDYRPDQGVMYLINKGMFCWYQSPAIAFVLPISDFFSAPGRQQQTSGSADFLNELSLVLGNLAIAAAGGI